MTTSPQTQGSPTFEEMMAHANAWQAECAAVRARDGFLIDVWGEDGNTYVAFGHVDRETFLQQCRWFNGEFRQPSEIESDFADITAADVQHSYVIAGERDGDPWYWWSVRDPHTGSHHIVSAVDEGAQPVTLLDL
jgi:hypothetical protein